MNATQLFRRQIAAIGIGVLGYLAVGTVLSQQRVETQAPTTESRLAALELKTQEITRGVGSFGRPYLQIGACVGIGTNASLACQRPEGEGAMLTVLTTQDRFAGYFEVTGVSAHTTPTTGVYASVSGPNPYQQVNIAVEGHARNSPWGNVALWADSQFALSSTLGQPVTTIGMTESNGNNQVLKFKVLAP